MVEALAAESIKQTAFQEMFYHWVKTSTPPGKIGHITSQLSGPDLTYLNRRHSLISEVRSVLKKYSCQQTQNIVQVRDKKKYATYCIQRKYHESGPSNHCIAQLMCIACVIHT